MADTLTVHLNRDGPQTLAAPQHFETTGGFEVAVHNHGTPAHVHLHLDDALASVAALDANSHYVESDTVRTVVVSVGDDFETVTGELEVTTSYGAVVDTVTVTVSEPPTVRVDEALSHPRTEETTDDRSTESLPLLGAVVLAVVVLVLAAAAIDEALALAVGVLAVGAGGAVAGYLLARS